MKRFHVHIAVDDLRASIDFYSTIFATAPSMEREGYAKWQLTDPAVNFAISQIGKACGVNHFGIQVDSDDELQEIADRLDNAEIKTVEQKNSSCCYANANKYWTTDPQGFAWESFHTLSEDGFFAAESKNNLTDESSACCIPDDNKADQCCH